MSVFKCKMCGGALEVQSGDSVAVCEYCGTKQTLPKLDDDRKANLYDRANHFRRNNDFDKAMGIYEQILNEDNTDAEAYWSIVLCRYGIEYVEDPASHKRIPTVNRAQFTSVFADEDYKSAIEHADGAQREIYEHEAKTIDEIQKGILAISQKEEPFDVFICYKETDASGRRTQDSVLANDLYHQLTQEGFKVFFARITLEDKLGTAYEPYIFAALNSAKVMVVLGTKPEYFNAVWVKNEWSRYLALIKNGAQKVLVPAYKDMDPYDLPEEFSHLQAQDMSKLGFMQDLIRGIKKLTATEEPKTTVKETVIVNNGNASNVNTAPLLKRAFMFLEDREWESADEYCEKVLDIDPENAEAYLGKLLAGFEISTKGELINLDEPFDDDMDYRKIIRFGDENLCEELKNYNRHIRERNELNRKNEIYGAACNLMDSAKGEMEYRRAATKFGEVIDFKEAKTKKEKCLELAEEARKEALRIAEEARKQAIYVDACSFKNQQTIKGYEAAILRFEQIFGFKDAEEQVAICKKKIEEIKIAEEKAKIEAERKAEAERIAAEAQRKKNKKIAAIVTPIVVLAIAAVVIFTTVIQPMMNYNAAVSLMENGQYQEAITAFEAMDFKDSEEKLLESKYLQAVVIMKEGRYEEAIVAFKALGEYKDSEKMIEECQNGIKELKYQKAVLLIEEKEYIEAYNTLNGISPYKDSSELMKSIYGKKENQILRSAEVGSLVSFGTYEQDGAPMSTDEINWIVLKNNGDRLLLISKEVIDCVKYNDTDEKVNWETCSLRKWLNANFYEEAFSEMEKAMISNVTLYPDTKEYYDNRDEYTKEKSTEDKIFILTPTEAMQLLDVDERIGVPTHIAKWRGCSTESFNNYMTYWWVRAPGYHDDEAVLIDADGDFGYSNVDWNKVGIRPAMWIDLSAVE